MIIDVSDSKGKSCGRVVAQVATMAEDPVRFYKQFCFCLSKFFNKRVLVRTCAIVQWIDSVIMNLLVPMLDPGSTQDFQPGLDP